MAWNRSSWGSAGKKLNDEHLKDEQAKWEAILAAEGLAANIPEVGSLADVADKEGVGFFSQQQYDEYNDVTDLPPVDQVLNKKAGFFIGQQAIEKRQAWQKRAKQHGTKEPATTGRVLPNEILHGTHYDPQKYKYGQTRNYLDIESVGTHVNKGSILSYAVVKKAENLDTGNWDIVSKRTRYYYPKREDKLLVDSHGVPVYDEAVGISGLTNENITLRRSQQAVNYSRHFDKREFNRLLTYLGDDPVVTHNGAMFDWVKLLNATNPGFSVATGNQIPDGMLPKGGLIDTLMIAEGVRGVAAGRNNLSNLYKAAYGHAPEQDGFTAHDALEDVQIMARVEEAMMKSKGVMGAVYKYLNNHRGVSTQWKGTTTQGYESMIRGLNMAQEDDVKSFINEFVDMDDGESISDYADSVADSIADDVLDITDRRQRTAGVINNITSAADTMKLVESISQLNANLSSLSGVHTGLNNNSTIKLASKLHTIQQRDEFLKDTFPEEGLRNIAVKRATMLYANAHKGVEEDLGWNAAVKPDVSEAVHAWGKQNVKAREQEWRAHRDERLGIKKDDDTTYRPLKEFGRLLKEEVNPHLQRYGKLIPSAGMNWAAGGTAVLDNMKEMWGDLSPFMPDIAHHSFSRWAKSAYMSGMSTIHGRQAVLDIAGQVGGGVADLVVPGSGNIVKGAVGAYQRYDNTRRQAMWDNSISTLNFWGGVAEMLIAPFKLLAGATRHLHASFTFLANGMNDMGRLGLPLTMLTGHQYSFYQYGTLTDRLMHQQIGSTNNSFNSIGTAGQGLFNLGQMNTNQLISSAVLGQFSNVYSQDANVEGRYADMVNSLLGRLSTASESEKASIMYHAGNIDPNLPARLQQMTNLGIHDYNDLINGNFNRRRGIFFRSIDQGEKNSFDITHYEWNASVEQFRNSRMRITQTIWNSFGKQLFNSFNEVMDMVARGNYGGAWEKIKDVAKTYWDKLTGFLSEHDINLDNIRGKVIGLWNKIATWLEPMMPKIKAVVKDVGTMILEGWRFLTNAALDVFGDGIERLRNTRIEFNMTKNGIEFIPHFLGSGADAVNKNALLVKDGNTARMVEDATNFLNSDLIYGKNVPYDVKQALMTLIKPFDGKDQNAADYYHSISPALNVLSMRGYSNVPIFRPGFTSYDGKEIRTAQDFIDEFFTMANTDDYNPGVRPTANQMSVARTGKGLEGQRLADKIRGMSNNAYDKAEQGWGAFVDSLDIHIKLDDKDGNTLSEYQTERQVETLGPASRKVSYGSAAYSDRHMQAKLMRANGRN